MGNGTLILAKKAGKNGGLKKIEIKVAERCFEFGLLK
jgi:hypothetical protein